MLLLKEIYNFNLYREKVREQSPPSDKKISRSQKKKFQGKKKKKKPISEKKKATSMKFGTHTQKTPS